MNRLTPSGGTRKALSVRSRGAIAVEVVLALVLLGLLPQTLELGDAARRFPLATTMVLLALLTLDLAMELVPAARRRLGFLEADYLATGGSTGTADAAGDAVAAAHREEAVTSAAGAAGGRHRVYGPWGALAWLILAAVGMFYLGYLAMTPLFLTAFFLWSRVSIKVALVITVTLSSFNYLVFYQYLGLR